MRLVSKFDHNGFTINKIYEMQNCGSISIITNDRNEGEVFVTEAIYKYFLTEKEFLKKERKEKLKKFK